MSQSTYLFLSVYCLYFHLSTLPFLSLPLSLFEAPCKKTFKKTFTGTSIPLELNEGGRGQNQEEDEGKERHETKRQETQIC